MWVPLGIYCFFYRRKHFIAVVAGVFISTLLAQILKRVVYPDELRPISFLSENFPVHIIDGVTMRKSHSFPSGHTTTAFAMALIMAYIINRKSWSVVLPLLALLAGYSRVYLAQHFPTDIFAGMCIGIVSAILSLLLYRKFIRYSNKKAASIETASVRWGRDSTLSSVALAKEDHQTRCLFLKAIPEPDLRLFFKFISLIPIRKSTIKCKFNREIIFCRIDISFIMPFKSSF